MPGDENSRDLKTEELLAIAREIRQRVRARHPSGSAAGADLPLADLMPLLHARDAAQAKVAAIGTVNPRAPGLANTLIQFAKKLVARALDWHVREQVEFNRAAIACLEATLQAFNELNFALTRVAAHLARLEALRGEVDELKDMRSHWIEWRSGWEHRLSLNETQFLRSVADLQSAFQHRVTLIEANFRELAASQHRDFTAALERSTLDIQKRLWQDLDRIRHAYESLIHNELRLVRQRAAATPLTGPPAPQPAVPAPRIDFLSFAERFRGGQQYVRRNQQSYVEHFAGCQNVLDAGCGRGEFLGLLREAGIPARGVDSSPECVALCHSQGLEAEAADLFEYLAGLPHHSLDGLFSAQVVEHLPPALVPELIRLAAAKLVPGGRLLIETPNPECLAIFATHFYLDPTHTRPIPPQLLVFYLEEAGFGSIEVRRLAPALESMPALAQLPPAVREAFFGCLDYAALARRL